jgi:hypothetical protein
MAGAGLGLRLHDNRHGTDLHTRAFDPWWAHARRAYLGLDGAQLPETTTLYYDPILDVHHRLPVSFNLTTAFYAAPQVPDDARRLFDAGARSAGIDRPLRLPLRAARVYGSSLLLTREWGLPDIEANLVEAIEASYQPTWDRERLGEFTWGLGLDEEHPRGQFNAFLAAAEAAGPGRWARLSAAPLERCPQVVGVDFPRLALRRAEWVDGVLHLRSAPLTDRPQERTVFRVIGAGPGPWQIVGPEGVEVRSDHAGLAIETPLVEAELELRPA